MKEMVNDCEKPEIVAIAGIASPFPDGVCPFTDTVKKVV